MADAQLSAAPRSTHATPHPSPHPMASPGYGKRSTPGQPPRTNPDFAHLPPREAAIAAYIDRLPDGADISVKTLAKELPYGQCALRTALNRIQAAGHLRRGREHVRGTGSARWITRTWFSRIARDDAWWTAFTRGGVPGEGEPDRPRQRPTRSRAFILLAALGRTAPALSLSYLDCVRLEPQVTQWFERGATEPDIVRALTAGLPTPIHSPAAVVRSRLTSKLPPEPPPPRPALRILECTRCGAPGRPEALPGGTCGPCRGEPTPTTAAVLLPEAVRAHVTALRTAANSPHARAHA
ncbi:MULTISPECIES: hypothetical protein [Streptomyces]|uniref:hypothetical protein n=1 Tax=Streptomyces TaxID=1883 RepID=UPI001E519757|nr:MULTISPECIES: hypothetical protein [Streptomyces]UFQ16495.1 hypothetical protein J2N69_16595 [Streptomyces huasconensis]WCL86097.1 hypothetical protein PPN52_16605 [Streptomyces sp. JCM 35825]